jgi:EAL domain-containing protein (putative c-di-GMP-specific phosphodiesterase class I)
MVGEPDCHTVIFMVNLDSSSRKPFMETSSKRILLVASDPVSAKRVAQTLRADGVDIVTCEEVEAAEALLSQSRVDVLVTDLFFGGQTGLEGLRLIHHVATHYPETTVIGVVDELDEEVQLLANRAGALFLLERPKESIEFMLPEALNARGDVQHLGKLEEFLKEEVIEALLQPIVSLQTGETLGAESLARGPKNLPLWNPEILFAYAAKKERLFETDLFCMRAALKEAGNLSDVGKLFINVRPRSLIHVDFADTMRAMCDEAAIAPSAIVLELTEQQTILNLKAFSQTLTELRQLGFGVALDDFGAGFANLQLVADLQPDYIKVSGIFCRNLEHDDIKQTIVGATTQMAKRLKIPTILEHVETEQECLQARLLGIDFAQGYYFCRPQTAEQLQTQGWFHGHSN